MFRRQISFMFKIDLYILIMIQDTDMAFPTVMQVNTECVS